MKGCYFYDSEDQCNQCEADYFLSETNICIHIPVPVIPNCISFTYY